ncbi:MAG: MMPL family transporter, partial [Myxococcales bacterium]|nr:MMPL family transporter [Myxococcales bacterium]
MESRAGRLFDGLFTWALRHRAPAIAVIVGLFAGSASFIRHLEVDVSLHSILAEDHPIMVREERILSIFGPSLPVVVALDDPALWTPAGLARVKHLTREFADLDGVVRVTSLSSTMRIIAEGDTLDVRAYLHHVPLTDAEVQALRRAAVADDLVVGNVLSPDGRTTAFVIDQDYQKGKEDKIALRVMAGIRDVLDREGLGDEARVVGDGAEVHVSGVAAIYDFLGRTIKRETLYFIAGGLGLIALLLAGTFKSIRGVLLPFSVIGLSLTTALGFMGVVGYNLSMATTILPPLIMVIGTADAVHLISHYYERLVAGADAPTAARESVRTIFVPCLMTSLTTAAGFASLLISEIVPVRRTGLVAAVGIGAAFVLTFTLLPLLLSFRHPAPKAHARAIETGPLTRFLRALSRLVEHHRGKVLVGTAALVALAAFAIPRIRVETNLRESFRKGSEVLESLAFVERRFAGVDVLKVHLEATDGTDFKDPGQMAALAEIADFIATQPGVGKVYSAAQIVREMNAALHGGDAKAKIIPAARAPIAEDLFLFGLNGTPEMEKLLSDDARQAAILARVTMGSTADYAALVAGVEKHLDARGDGHIRHEIGGPVNLVSRLVNTLVESQLRSFALAFAVIFLMMFAMLRDLRLALVSMIPNTVPIVVAAGAMGALDIALDTNTVMVASIAIGIAVDDT